MGYVIRITITYTVFTLTVEMGDASFDTNVRPTFKLTGGKDRHHA